MRGAVDPVPERRAGLGATQAGSPRRRDYVNSRPCGDYALLWQGWTGRSRLGPCEVTPIQRRTAMRVIDNGCIVSSEANAMLAAAILALASAVFCTTAAAANIAGQVLGGGAPI